MKINELIGPALDWAVAKAEELQTEINTIKGKHVVCEICHTNPDLSSPYHPSTKWNTGGPIIEREKIGIEPIGKDWRGVTNYLISSFQSCIGPTPLIAAMRALVQKKLGEHVYIPEELR